MREVVRCVGIVVIRNVANNNSKVPVCLQAGKRKAVA